jgi:hypothetical protein
MITEINRQQSFDKIENANFGTRSYYFHPDEDFREDWDWGKISDPETQENDL